MWSLSKNSQPEQSADFVSHGFVADTRAVDMRAYIKMTTVLILAIVSIIAISAMSFYPSSASQAEAVTSQGMMMTKSDRDIRIASADNCETQAWGAWSEDCAAALSGASKVRKVSFVTVAEPAKSVNETILARYAVFE